MALHRSPEYHVRCKANDSEEGPWPFEFWKNDYQRFFLLVAMATRIRDGSTLFE